MVHGQCCAIMWFFIKQHRQPSIVGVYYCFILHPPALKQHSCYHNIMSQEKEEIASQVMYKSVYAFLVRATPILYKSRSNHITVAIWTIWIPTAIHNKIKLYADDMLLYSHIVSVNDCHNLQQDLDLLVQWAKRWECHSISWSMNF